MLDLKGLRYDLDVSQKQIAELLKCSQSFVSAVELGIRILPRNQLRTLIDKFGKDVIDRHTISAPTQVINIERGGNAHVKENHGAVGSHSTYYNNATCSSCQVITSKEQTINELKERIIAQQEQIKFLQDLITNFFNKTKS